MARRAPRPAALSLPTPSAEVVEVFDRSIADAVAAGDTARADERRLLRAYFCDPAFRAKLTDWVARENGL
jgi:hypothetical protein